MATQAAFKRTGSTLEESLEKSDFVCFSNTVYICVIYVTYILYIYLYMYIYIYNSNTVSSMLYMY